MEFNRQAIKLSLFYGHIQAITQSFSVRIRYSKHSFRSDLSKYSTDIWGTHIP